MSVRREQEDGPKVSLRQVAENDGRYDVRAFQFLFEALRYSQEMFGKDIESHCDEERHVTGQELCEGIRRFALDEFGLMAKTVFEGWGIYRTADFGEIVYLLIRNRLMAKRDSDSIEDFHDVYDFNTAFEEVFFSAKKGQKKFGRQT